ncbi:hypothetical protein GCM10009639_32960 [Kitasatospora putterlickiae]|uniref:Uncharacterized protein n=1 Tax=Kitasatospora putterlickiae TaxID=221725 RepID=A0ABN1Y355_9ACTN
MTMPASASPDVQIRFVVPTSFHDIPVLGTEEQVAERLWELACEVLASDPDEVRARWAALLARMIPSMAEAGVIYAGLCLVDVGGRPSTASVVASLAPLGGIGSQNAVDTLLPAFARARPAATVTAIELPAGRAAAVIDGVVTPTDGGTFASSVIQVHLPLPNEFQLLSLELSTPCAEDWELYSEVFAGIVRSVHLEFADLPGAAPGPGAAPAPAPGVEAKVRAAFG